MLCYWELKGIKKENKEKEKRVNYGGVFCVDVCVLYWYSGSKGKWLGRRVCGLRRTDGNARGETIEKERGISKWVRVGFVGLRWVEQGKPRVLVTCGLSKC